MFYRHMIHNAKCEEKLFFSTGHTYAHTYYMYKNVSVIDFWNGYSQHIFCHISAVGPPNRLTWITTCNDFFLRN